MPDRPRYGPPSRYVTLYCKAPSHEGQPWIIGTWTEGATDEGQVYWRYYPDQYLHGTFVRSATDRHDPARVAVPAGRGPAVPVDMSTPEGRLARMQADERGETNYAQRLRCHLCGETMKRTEANLQRDLSRLADAGYSDVSLTEYRAAVR